MYPGVNIESPRGMTYEEVNTDQKVIANTMHSEVVFISVKICVDHKICPAKLDFCSYGNFKESLT